MPHRALLFLRHVEAAELDFGGAFAGTEVASPVAHQIERRDTLCYSRGMIDQRRKLNDSMAEADVLRALAARREENFRRRRMRILLEEVMLGCPHVVESEAIGEFDLFERVLEQLMFGIASPWPWELMLIETANFH